MDFLPDDDNRENLPMRIYSGYKMKCEMVIVLVG